MNNIKIFKNEQFGQVRTLTINNEPWFVGKDVAEILGYSNPNEALQDHIDKEDKLNSKTLSSFTLDLGQRGGWLINESGLYSLILSSKLPKAKEFKHWVTREVLPSIRKTGQYSMLDSYLIEDPIIRAERWIEEQKEKMALLEENEEMKPKADYFDELVDRKTLTNFTETAKQLHIKRKELIDFLIEKRFIYRNKKGKILPYENKNKGYFEIKESYNEKTSWSGVQTFITAKGREAFRLMLIGY